MSNTGRVTAALLVGLVFTGHASACLNDTAIKTDEQEFRSQYGQTGNVEPAVSDRWHGMNPWALAGLAVGSGLIAGSGLVLYRRRAPAGAL